STTVRLIPVAFWRGLPRLYDFNSTTVRLIHALKIGGDRTSINFNSTTVRLIPVAFWRGLPRLYDFNSTTGRLIHALKIGGDRTLYNFNSTTVRLIPAECSFHFVYLLISIPLRCD